MSYCKPLDTPLTPETNSVEGSQKGADVDSMNLPFCELVGYYIYLTQTSGSEL